MNVMCVVGIALTLYMLFGLQVFIDVLTSRPNIPTSLENKRVIFKAAVLLNTSFKLRVGDDWDAAAEPLQYESSII